MQLVQSDEAMLELKIATTGYVEHAIDRGHQPSQLNASRAATYQH